MTTTTKLHTESQCPACGHWGHPQIRVVDAGYHSAADLGRPAGAKGSDWTQTEKYCWDCGQVGQDFVPGITPCWVCESSTPDIRVTFSEYAEWVGFFDFISGVPDDFNCCEGCKSEAITRIKELAAQAVESGAYDE